MNKIGVNNSKHPQTLHTKAGKIYINATLFLRLGLPSTLIRHENGAFRN